MLFLGRSIGGLK